MAGTVPRRLLVAESDPALRRLVAQRMVCEGFEVVELADPVVVSTELLADDFDIVVLEAGGSAGFAPLISLRAVSDVPAVALLWPSPEADEAVALDFGADDCVVRPVSIRHLVARTNAVLRRTAPLSRTLRYGTLEIDLPARTVRVGHREVELSAREFDLLAFLAAHPDEVFTRDQLLVDVWRSSADWQQTETVTEHIHRVRARLEDEPTRPRWLLTVRGVGYRFAP